MSKVIFFIYNVLWFLLSPFIFMYMQWRKMIGKEKPGRMQEKFGLATRDRPVGPLLWIHGASVGESLAVLPLIETLEEKYPKLSILMTSGTVTSANILKKRLPGRVIHQFVPLDKKKYVKRFLKHWQPDLVFWLESELWPNQLLGLKKRKVPAVLINARLSPSAYKNWKRFSSLVRVLLSCFDKILAATNDVAEKLKELGAKNVLMTGNLKYAGGPLPVDEDVLSEMHVHLRNRPHIVFASSHPGEELLMAKVHKKLKAQIPDLLTIIVPRHPDRGEAIAEQLCIEEVKVVRRSLDQEPDKSVDVYLADTLGELGVFFRLTAIVIMGGSFVPIGGHNPLEPAYFGASLIWGPNMYNFPEIEAAFLSAKAAIKVQDETQLELTLMRLLRHNDEVMKMGVQAKRVLKEHKDVLDKTLHQIEPLINACLKANNIIALEKSESHESA